jgi:hypothetical protein
MPSMHAERLRDLAVAELRKANRSPDVAVAGLVPQILADAELIVELMRAVPQQVRVAALAYLYERLREMHDEMDQGASHQFLESQVSHDRPAIQQDDARARQAGYGSQRHDDRPASSEGGGPSHIGVGSHRRPDRPGPAPRAKRPAPKSRISKGAALTYASNSIFALRVGQGERYLGDFSKAECRDWAKKGMAMSHLFGRLVTEVHWPDDKTKLSECASEQVVREIHNSAYAMLDNLGVTNVSR